VCTVLGQTMAELATRGRVKFGSRDSNFPGINNTTTSTSLHTRRTDFMDSMAVFALILLTSFCFGLFITLAFYTDVCIRLN